jgi:hypothetical protein
MTQKLDIAFWNYDRTRSLADGSVKIEGADVAFHSARIVPEIFEAMIRRRAYDVSELGMTYFLRTFDEEGRSPFLAIPVFPVRAFRHGAIYINRNSGIEKPQNLIGKRIGELALYGHDAGVIPKGILSDDFDVKPEQSHWIIGGIDFPVVPLILCLTLCQLAWKSNGSALTSILAPCWNEARSTRSSQPMPPRQFSKVRRRSEGCSRTMKPWSAITIDAPAFSRSCTPWR